MSERQTQELVCEGAYIAEVDVTLIETDHEWSPHISAADTRRIRAEAHRRSGVGGGRRIVGLQPEIIGY